MAAAMVDHHRGFTTTMGFQVRSGFQAGGHSLHGLPPVPHVSLGNREEGVTQEDTTPSSARSVGWSGLLEISRASGASGVMGQRTMTDEVDAAKDCKLEICCTAHTNPAIRRLVKAVIRGLKACQEPEKALDGMGGTYFFLNDAGRKAAIIKPCDEEPLAPNNPKGYIGRQLGDPGWKPTVRVGEAAMREVAAYLLDHDHFARVPTSVLIRARHPAFCYNNRSMGSACRSSVDLSGTRSVLPHTSLGACSADMEALVAAGPPPASTVYDASGDDAAATSKLLPMKLGSLQEFVQHECDTSEMGASRFSASDVHRIGILDLRLFNTDRHAGNMLVRKVMSPRRSGAASAVNMAGALLGSGACSYELVPIDHGFCLPETLEAPYFEWLHWPQAMLPFSDEELLYIENLDVEADKELLRKELPNLRPECLRVLEVATTLLKAGAAAGLTLYELASIMTRGVVAGGDEEPSELEVMVGLARHCAEQALDEELDFISDCESTDAFAMDNDVEVLHIEMEISPSGRLEPGSDSNSGHHQQGGRGNEYVMLFDLEDDGTGVMLVKPRRPLHISDPEVSSPSGFSVGSSISSGDHLMSFALDSMPTTPEATVPGASTPADAITAMRPMHLSMLDSAEAPFVPAVARSVAADGDAWRRHHKQRHRVVAAGALRRAAPQAYPPPVLVGAKPSSTGGVFSDLTEPQWEAFMKALCEQIDDGLKCGRWRAASKESVPVGGIASSCPRF